MAVFERETGRELGIKAKIRVDRSGPRKGFVRVIDEDRLLVLPDQGSWLIAGSTDKDGRFIRTHLIREPDLVVKESVGRGFSGPEIIWRRKTLGRRLTTLLRRGRK